MPYVYRLYCKDVDKFYIGSRTKKGHKSPYNDLFVEYFSSSSVVALLIEQYGINSFSFEILREFDNIEDCIFHEDMLLRAISKDKRKMFLNRNFSAGGSVIKNQTHLMITDGKIYLQFPRDIQIPDGWKVEWKFKPPSQKGKKHYINVSTLIKVVIPDGGIIPDGYISITEFRKKCLLEKSLLPKRIVWITDGITNTKILKSETPPLGWEFGKTVKEFKKDRKIRTDGGSTLGRTCYTDGISNKFIKDGDILPSNWSKGITNGRHNNK